MKTFKHFNSLKIIASLLLVATPLSADDLISEPTEFYNGEIADAADINSNFKIVFDSVRALQGATDTKMLVGEVEPAAELGNVGDIYFDTVNLLLWGPKVEEGWVTSVSIKGAPGGRGPKGDPGSDGMDGSDGADGKDGDSCTIEQENGGAFITCGSGTSAAIYDGTNGTDGINGTNGTDGEDGVDGQDGRSCTSTQGDGVVTISCDDGTSGEVASGRCSATQSGSNVVIDCADGSGGILASAGTVVTFLDGQLGQLDYTFNTGDIVLYDANDIQLGRIDPDAGSTQWALVVREEPYLLLRINNGSTAVNFPNHSGIRGSLYYDGLDCTGAVFKDEDIGSSAITPPAISPSGTFYTSTGQRYNNKLVKSSSSWGDCSNQSSVKGELYLYQAYIPAEEILNATIPLYIEQLP